MAKKSRFAVATQSGAQRTGADRATLAAVPADVAEAVRLLAEQLPDLDDVRAVEDDDQSPLTDVERVQKEATERVLDQAARSVDEAVWIVAQGLERAAKGRWWRGEFPTYDAYVRAKVGRSSSYARRLRSAAPLALETGEKTGRVPNPGQAREQLKFEQRFDRHAAVALFGVVYEVTAEVGDSPTAANLSAVAEAVPEELPADQAEAVVIIEQTARETLGVPIGTRDDEDQGEGEGDAEPSGASDEDDVIDAEIVEDPLDYLREVMRNLRQANKSFTRAKLREDSELPEYAKLQAAALSAANTVRNKLAQVPPAPAPDAEEQQREAPADPGADGGQTAP